MFSGLVFRGLLLPDMVRMRIRRDRFKKKMQKQAETRALQKTTEFVESYLRAVSVWSFDNKDQNLLTSEVGSCDCHIIVLARSM